MRILCQEDKYYILGFIGTYLVYFPQIVVIGCHFHVENQMYGENFCKIVS